MTEEQKAQRRENLARARARQQEKMRQTKAASPAASAPENEAEPLPPAPEEPPAPIVAEPDDAPDTLSAAEVAHIEGEARKQVEAELAKKRRADRKSLIAKALGEETDRQRREAGLTDAGDDMIEWMVNVAPFAAGVTLDGHTYPHGTWRKTTRRVYDSCRDIMARSWESEDRAGNPNKKFAEWRAMAGGVNPMFLERRLADGSFTVGVDYRVNGVTGAAAIGGA